jgi:hypothetical protein
MTARPRLFELATGLVVLAVAQPAFGHGDVMRIGSSQQGGGQLIIESGFQFELDVHLMLSATVGDRALYTSIFPSFTWILEPQNGDTEFPLNDDTEVRVTLADPISPGAAMRVAGRLLDAPGESATIGTVSRDPEDHVHPEWQLILTNGVVGHYAISFSLSSNTGGYSVSPVYQLTLTNEEAEATPTASTTPTPTDTFTAEVTATATSVQMPGDTGTATPSATATSSDTATPSPTKGASVCVGDCNADGQVTIEELVQTTGLTVRGGKAGGEGPIGCAAADQDESGTITVDELLAAIGSALSGCPNDRP